MALPAELEAVRVYIVVVVGDIAVDPAAATLPMPGCIVTEAALETFQLRVAVPPDVMLLGEMLNKLITGIPEVG